MTNVDQCEKNYKLAYEINTIATKNISRLCGNNTKLITYDITIIYTLLIFLKLFMILIYLDGQIIYLIIGTTV